MFVTPIEAGTLFPVASSEATVEVIEHRLGDSVVYQPILPMPGAEVVMAEWEFAERVLGLRYYPGEVWPSVPF